MAGCPSVPEGAEDSIHGMGRDGMGWDGMGRDVTRGAVGIDLDVIGTGQD